jgi:hypothetical protein
MSPSLLWFAWIFNGVPDPLRRKMLWGMHSESLRADANHVTMIAKSRGMRVCGPKAHP